MSRGARRQADTDVALPENVARHVGALISGPFSDFAAPMAIHGLDDRLIWSTNSYNQLLLNAPENPSFADLLHPSRWLDTARLQRERVIWRDGAVEIGGKDHLLQARFAPVLDNAGVLAAVASLIQATPNQAKASRDLVRLQERLSDVIRLVSDWVWETDAALNLNFLSERVSKIMGYYPAELIGKPLHALALNRRAGRTLLKRTDTLAPFRDHVFEAVDKAGQMKLLLLSVIPIFDPDTGAHIGFRGTANDITELTERERNLLAAKEAAEQANRAKSHFLAHISHELRTPLNSIIGFSEMMRLQTRGPLGAPEYLSYAEDIHGSANQLLTVINDILGLTSVEAGTFALHDAETTVAMIVDPTVAAYRAKAEQAGIALHCDLGEDRLHLVVDQRVTRQILGNLLSNAIKFTPRGGRVEVRASRAADGALAITVSDTGIGISEEMIEHVFMPFFQAEGGTTRKFEGTGLGLALSKRLAELIGATLSISSRRGVGTAVSLCLPADKIVLTGI